MKKIMILGAGILQLPAIAKAMEMGLETIAVDMNPDAVGFTVPGIKKEIISTIDTPAILEAARKHRINGIMTLASDMPMQTVAVVSRALGLTGIDQDTALRATNKAYMREALKQHGVPVPTFFRVTGADAFAQAVETIRSQGYRCIVKPTDNSGSRGVYLLEEDEDIFAAYAYSLKYSRSGELVVEEYMEGPEVSVETLAVNGEVHVIQITDKLTTGAPFFVEMGHSQPSLLPEELKSSIASVAVSANKAIGIREGPSHTEIKITKDGPKIVELGARLGGDCITTHLVPLSTGVDMVESCIKIAIGESPNVRAKRNKGSAIRYFESTPGMVREIRGISQAESIPGIVKVFIAHGVGERIEKIKNSIDRVGFVIAQADTREQADAICQKALNTIQIVITE